MTLERVEAPWTDDQVESLNAYQESGVFHPFTWGDGEEKVDLIATNAGWHYGSNKGPVVQTWAHSFMADWSWKKMSAGTRIAFLRQRIINFATEITQTDKQDLQILLEDLRESEISGSIAIDHLVLDIVENALEYQK